MLITGYNSSYQSISKLYSNDGTGVFTEVAGIPLVGVYLSSIAFSDVDGDGDKDVLITGYNSSYQRISKLYSNAGTGVFTEVAGTPFLGVYHSSIAFSDVDGDGDKDVLITGYNSSYQSISKLYSNDGTGVFTEVAGTPFVGVAQSSIAFSDVDGDGDQDVLITGYNSSNQPISKLYSNDGTGVFTEVAGTPFVGVAQSSIAFSDVDGDGDQDVLITGYNSSNQPISKLYSNDGTGVFTEVAGTPFVGVAQSSIAFSDVDGDGDQDVLITGYNSSNQPISKLYSNDGTGVFTEVAGTPFVGVAQSSIAFSDVDGDGDQDVLITGYNSSYQRISKLYSNAGTGVFTEVAGTPFLGVYHSSIAFSDVDGDGDKDVLITGYNSSYQSISKLYSNDGTGVFTEVAGTPFVGVVAGSIAFSDIDGDGDQDVLITGVSDSGIVSYLYRNLIISNKPPTAICKNITAQLDATGSVTILAADIDNGSTDAEGAVTLSINRNTFSCADIGKPVQVTLTVTDIEGVTATCVATITVEDTVKPTVITKTNKVQLDANGLATITPAEIDNLSTDNCGIASYSIDIKDFTCANVGNPVTVTLTVIDIHGNSNSKTATVTVEDKIAPIVVTKNITVQLNAAGTTTIVAADVNNGSTDACGISLLALDKTSFTCANVGVNTVTLKVTDTNGNVTSKTATVTVEDKITPVIVTKNITIQLDAAGTASIVVADVNNGSTDNCGISLVELDKTSFTCANIGANTVTLKVTDNNGNIATQTAIVTVEDKIAPVVIVKNITVQLDASSNILIAATDVNNGSTDNCGISLLELDKTSFSCADVGENTVTLKVTDNNGNVSTKTAVVTVENTQPNLIRKHFDDVIFFDNSSIAFVKFSWYKNGVLVSSQTAQYFKDNGVLNGEYYAIATKVDGTVVTTCPLTFSASIVDEYLKIAPNPVKSNVSYQIITNVDSAKLQNARITVFNILGVLVNDKMVDGITTVMISPNMEGVYVVRMTLANGKYFTKNLLVKN